MESRSPFARQILRNADEDGLPESMVSSNYSLIFPCWPFRVENMTRNRAGSVSGIYSAELNQSLACRVATPGASRHRTLRSTHGVFAAVRCSFGTVATNTH